MSETPGQECQNTPTENRGVFCDVKHDGIAFTEAISSYWQPCLCSVNPKSFHCVLRNKIRQDVWSILAAFSRDSTHRPPF